LLLEEQSWRLKSHAIWIREGDKKTKFFHKFVSHRRNVNTIWSLDDKKGDIQRSLPGMKYVAKGFFEGVYDNPLGEDLLSQLHSLEHMPQFFTQGDNEELWKAVTKEELEKVLHSMPKDKSPGLDEWTQEFFSAYIDLVGDDLLRVIEES